MDDHAYLIDHPSQLRRLGRWMGPRPRGAAPVRLGGALAEHPKRQAWERQLHRELHACGCSAATVGLLLGLVVLAPLLAGGLLLGGRVGLAGAVGVGLGLAAGTAVLGRFVGKLAARRRLADLVREIELEWPTPPGRVEERAACG